MVSRLGSVSFDLLLISSNQRSKQPPRLADVIEAFRSVQSEPQHKQNIAVIDQLIILET
jgi:hypothetical protein